LFTLVEHFAIAFLTDLFVNHNCVYESFGISPPFK